MVKQIHMAIAQFLIAIAMKTHKVTALQQFGFKKNL
jgi:hypothetical protein